MLGDAVHEAIEAVGLGRLVRRWLGDDCGCEERRQKLNALHSWARGGAASRLLLLIDDSVPGGGPVPRQAPRDTASPNTVLSRISPGE